MAVRLDTRKLRLSRERRGRAVLAVAAAALLGSLAFYLPGPYGHGDITTYHGYALAFWSGAERLHSLPVEYPPFALAAFSLTLLPPLPNYVSVFGLWMLLLVGAGYAAIRRMESARAAEVFAVYLVLGCFATVLGRYDLVPAATVVVAYWAARHRRFELAYVMLALGTLLKLYPAVLLPVLVIEHHRALGTDPFRLPPRPVARGVALFVVGVAAVFLLGAAADSDDWLGAFTFQAHRPLQVESLPATVLWLTGFAGLPVSAVRSFNSYNLVGQAGWAIAFLAELALAGGCLVVYWRQVTGRIDLGRAVTLCLLVVLCTNRVFSPQYLMWVLPLVAIVEGEYDTVWLAICALTTLIFPYAYDWTGMRGRPMPASYPLYLPALIATRNVLLVVATVRFARRGRTAATAVRPSVRWTA
jgi:hypothetical protein